MGGSRHKLVLMLRVLAAAVLLMAVARASLFTVYRVAGTSMLDTLQDGDRILVADESWLVHPVLAGDTVVFEVHDEVLVKRVVGAPGDLIALDKGALWRNGKRVEEDIPGPYKVADSMHALTLGGDEYFVMGDHRAVSVDSRDFGPVPVSQILGKVMLRMSGEGISTVAALDRH